MIEKCLLMVGEALPTSSQVKVSAFNNIKIAPGAHLNLGGVSVNNG
jgi:hypothetical protein